MDDYSPYISPHSPQQTPKPGTNAVRPGVVVWFKVYASCMLALYILVAVGGVFLLAFSADIAGPEKSAPELQLMGAIYGMMGVVFSILFGIGMFVPRRTWGWIYSIVLICLGLTSCCTLPACIPLIIFWLKPETKSYFGMS